jgi:hypothetical protein
MQKTQDSGDKDAPSPFGKLPKKPHGPAHAKDLFGSLEDISAITYEPFEAERNPAEFLSNISVSPGNQSILNRAFMEDSRILADSTISSNGLIPQEFQKKDPKETICVMTSQGPMSFK